MRSALGRGFLTASLAFLFACLTAFSQIDPYHRNLLQLGYDQPIQQQSRDRRHQHGLAACHRPDLHRR